jgi:hypothetical protein
MRMRNTETRGPALQSAGQELRAVREGSIRVPRAPRSTLLLRRMHGGARLSARRRIRSATADKLRPGRHRYFGSYSKRILLNDSVIEFYSVSREEKLAPPGFWDAHSLRTSADLTLTTPSTIQVGHQAGTAPSDCFLDRATGTEAVLIGHLPAGEAASFVPGINCYWPGEPTPRLLTRRHVACFY